MKYIIIFIIGVLLFYGIISALFLNAIYKGSLPAQKNYFMQGGLHYDKTRL
jgi:hypothetical protein